MKVQQHQFGLTDIKAAIHLDKIRIRQYCVRHDDGVAIYDTLKYNIESSKNVKNFYLDPKSKLGWCVIPKVNCIHKNISITNFPSEKKKFNLISHYRT